MDFATDALIFFEEVKIVLENDIIYSKVGMMDDFIQVKADSESKPNLTTDSFFSECWFFLVFFL